MRGWNLNPTGIPGNEKRHTGHKHRFKFPTDWVGKNVKMILENQVYLGHMVSQKTQTKSFKNKKLVPVPEDEWIIVKNTHEAIVDEETFELIQKFISVKKRPNKTGRLNMFVGLVKCPDCGRNMAFSNPNGREPRFRCRTYARNSNLCTTHAISYDALQQIVMGDIQNILRAWRPWAISLSRKCTS